MSINMILDKKNDCVKFQGQLLMVICIVPLEMIHAITGRLIVHWS